ncbi:hypothetical protein, partial [Erwinia sp. V71]|uniref:hypothetical protein n=1 Tax=Erwinia sp. V71 TaxID=3369424 RepID=UPI003F63F90C
VPAAFSGLCRVKTGGLALHFELESAYHQCHNQNRKKDFHVFLIASSSNRREQYGTGTTCSEGL